jgi:hypothetical protein
MGIPTKKSDTVTTQRIEELKKAWFSKFDETHGKEIFEFVDTIKLMESVAGLLCMIAPDEISKDAAMFLEHRDSWHTAHGKFDHTRDLSLSAMKAVPQDDALVAKLGAIEQIYEIAYNETNPDDPFDSNTGWWLLVNLRCFCLATDSLERGWEILNDLCRDALIN